MKVKLVPQVNVRDVIDYEFSGEKIITRVNEFEDTFDFSLFTQDGEVDIIKGGIETSLPINPIVSVKRENGVLYVELLNYIGFDATEEEKFPDWVEVV